jgi:hypothetical protein
LHIPLLPIAEQTPPPCINFINILPPHQPPSPYSSFLFSPQLS